MTLASGGILSLAHTTLTFTADVTYQPNCASNDSYYNNTVSTIQGYHDPFYASSTVLIYVVATTTVISWFLLTLLLISPGSWFLMGTTRTTSWLTGRGASKGASGRPYILSASSRPWLQKIACLLVTIALTIASADTFKFASREYNLGYMNAEQLRNDVVGSLEIRIMRVISDIFIWLAQVQTLIRLFPRRKEKLIIKWFGLLLILLDSVFGCLNGFYATTKASPRDYKDAIPALSYLFELSLSLLYGAWVCYYIATKRRFAFFSTDMPSISVVALLSLLSIAIPVGFFVADIAVPAVSGWGDFFRWIGAAAASVLVWEWVERIEVLEREEKRDGILGREIFEEDEIGDESTTSDPYSRRSSSVQSSMGIFGKSMVRFRSTRVGKLADRVIKRQAQLSKRPRAEVFQLRSSKTPADHGGLEEAIVTTITHQGPAHPQIVINRNEDSSTPSTIYAVHYHPIVDSPAPADLTATNQDVDVEAGAATIKITNPTSSTNSSTTPLRRKSSTTRPPRHNWHTSAPLSLSLFRRQRKSPPLEIKAAMSLNGIDEVAIAQPLAAAIRSPEPNAPSSVFVLKRTLGRLAATSLPRRSRPHPDVTAVAGSDEIVQPTIIPAPPRGSTWSPGVMRHSPVGQGVYAGQPVGQDELNVPDVDARPDERKPQRDHAHDDVLGNAIDDEHDGAGEPDVSDEAHSDAGTEYVVSVAGLEEDEGT